MRLANLNRGAISKLELHQSAGVIILVCVHYCAFFPEKARVYPLDLVGPTCIHRKKFLDFGGLVNTKMKDFLWLFEDVP